MNIDKKDRLILEALQTDARQSLAALGKRIGLSQPAMSERVRKLESAGVIEGYGARVNLRALGVAWRPSSASRPPTRASPATWRCSRPCPRC